MNNKKTILAAFGLSIFALVSSAFAAGNTVPASKAGDGAGAISGYTVTNVKHTINASNPRNIDSVAFDLDTHRRSARP